MRIIGAFHFDSISHGNRNGTYHTYDRSRQGGLLIVDYEKTHCLICDMSSCGSLRILLRNICNWLISWSRWRDVSEGWKYWSNIRRLSLQRSPYGMRTVVQFHPSLSKEIISVFHGQRLEIHTHSWCITFVTGLRASQDRGPYQSLERLTGLNRWQTCCQEALLQLLLTPKPQRICPQYPSEKHRYLTYERVKPFPLVLVWL